MAQPDFIRVGGLDTDFVWPLG